MDVRKARNPDIEGIQTVARRSWEHDYPGILSRETITDTVEEWYAPERLEFAIDRDDALLVVAVADDAEGGIVGFAHAVRSEGMETVLRLYVDPDHRGRGIGTRLLETVRADADERGGSRLEAMVFEENDPGNAFYRSYGFERRKTGTTAIDGEEYAEAVYELSW